MQRSSVNSLRGMPMPLSNMLDFAKSPSKRPSMEEKYVEPEWFVVFPITNQLLSMAGSRLCTGRKTREASTLWDYYTCVHDLWRQTREASVVREDN